MSACSRCETPSGAVRASICDGCFAIALEIAAANERRFQMLRSAGVSREMANQIMIERNDGGPPS